MIKGWHESHGKIVGDGQYLLSFDAFYKQDKRFKPTIARMAMSVYVQTWGMRMLDEMMKEERQMDEMEYEDEMFSVRVKVSSLEFLRQKAKEKKGVPL